MARNFEQSLGAQSSSSEQAAEERGQAPWKLEEEGGQGQPMDHAA